MDACPLSAIVENVFGLDGDCEGSLQTGPVWVLDERERVECPVCGKLLEPGYARLVPAHEPEAAANYTGK